MSNVKGSAITSRIRFVREHYGEEGYHALIALLAPEDRTVIQARILPHAWVSYALFLHVNVEIDRLFGQGDLALCYEMGRYSAELNLPTLYRIFYRLGSPMFVFRKAAQVWSVHYDTGHIEPVEDGPGAVRIRMLGVQEPHRAHCLSVLGWASKSVELSGGVLETADETRCRMHGDEVCELRLAWK